MRKLRLHYILVFLLMAMASAMTWATDQTTTTCTFPSKAWAADNSTGGLSPCDVRTFAVD